MTQTTETPSHANRVRPYPPPTVPPPSIEELIAWEFEDGGCEATDGCWVEPDGMCEHGHPSWLLVLGLI